ncbi:MAG: M48 family metallopeptidase [Gammaproteobacteria bacterium]|nr:M48 family metallopeptidase [Gammaproteobacteria bacterium]
MPGTTDLLRVGTDQVPCEIRLSRRRTLGIEVHPEPRVIVRAPSGWSRALIESRLAERAAWIGRHVERFRGLAAVLPPPPAYVTGDHVPYLGELHRLEVLAARRPAVYRLPGILQVGVPGGTGAQRVRRALESWYRDRARELFATILEERFSWFEGRGHARPTIAVRKMTSRWGTLAGAGRRGTSRMTLNLALIRAPRECGEYVLVHELCHLEHRGHGRAFYRLMEARLPDWRQRKRQLESLLLIPG